MPFARQELGEGCDGPAERLGHGRLRCLPCAVHGGGPEVGVGIEGGRRFRVAERALRGDHVAPGGDQAGGLEVPQVVEFDAGEAGVAKPDASRSATAEGM